MISLRIVDLSQSASKFTQSLIRNGWMIGGFLLVWMKWIQNWISSVSECIHQTTTTRNQPPIKTNSTISEDCGLVTSFACSLHSHFIHFGPFNHRSDYSFAQHQFFHAPTPIHSWNSLCIHSTHSWLPSDHSICITIHSISINWRLVHSTAFFLWCQLKKSNSCCIRMHFQSACFLSCCDSSLSFVLGFWCWSFLAGFDWFSLLESSFIQ